MKNKMMKILIVLASMVLVLSMSFSSVYAMIAPNQVSASDPSSSDIQNLGGRILGIVQTVGVVLSVIILSVLGIKYMMGSASEKAEYKKTMIPYLVGALLIFGASAIAKAVIAISENLTAGN